MPYERDVRAFHDRSGTYDDGWLGRMHQDIAARTADLAVAAGGRARRVLDVGCGTGILLRRLAHRLPEADELVGIDAAEGMIAIAKSKENDLRLRFLNGVAEELPFPDASFDLVVSTTSFDHWQDQGEGLAECARVLAPNGRFVFTDQFSLLLVPTLLFGRRDRARTRGRAQKLLTAAGFRTAEWHRLYGLIIGSVVATKEG